MTVKKQDLIGVIATRAKAIDFWSFMHYLPNPDPVLKKWGRTFQLTAKSYPIATWVAVCAAEKRQSRGLNGALRQPVTKKRTRF